MLVLLKEKEITKDFFVSNCDTLVKNDLLDIYEHHKKNLNLITIVVSYKEYQIPYGIFNTNNSGKLIKITEKPTKNYLVNTGLYVLNPKIFTKSGIMVGLGEETNEVIQVMDDLRAANVDFLTIGQYLQPTRKHIKIHRFLSHHWKICADNDDLIKEIIDEEEYEFQEEIED